MDVTSYLLGKQAGGGGGQPSLQNKSVTITENGTQNVTADVGYDGLRNVGITTNVQPDLETKSVTITENTTTTITPTSGKDGLSSVEVTTNVSGGGGLDWSAIGYSGTPQSVIDGYDYALEIMNEWTPSTSLLNKFNGDTKLIFMPLVDTSTTTSMIQTFAGCTSLLSVAQLDTSNVTNMSSMFSSCTSLSTIPLLNISNVTNISQMFASCTNLKSIPKLNTSNVTNMSYLFLGCNALEDFPDLDAGKVTSFSGMFGNRSSFSSFSDTSLDNVLKMCISATSYTGTKTLATLGFNAYSCPATRIQTLPHYQDFINAGWTIGY